MPAPRTTTWTQDTDIGNSTNLLICAALARVIDDISAGFCKVFSAQWWWKGWHAITGKVQIHTVLSNPLDRLSWFRFVSSSSRNASSLLKHTTCIIVVVISNDISFKPSIERTFLTLSSCFTVGWNTFLIFHSNLLLKGQFLHYLHVSLLGEAHSWYFIQTF